MSVMVSELYEALRAAGVDEAGAKAAARAVLSADARTDLATKADLSELKSDLTWRMLLMTGAFLAAVGTLKLFA